MKASGARARERRLRRIGDRLRLIREGTGLDAREFGERCGIHPSDITRWERVALCEATGASADFLLGLADEPFPSRAVPADAMPPQLLREAVRLTHPDLHTGPRQELATRVTQALNALAGRPVDD
jgi:transcriptional regulator with XRE-family HTH domain